MSDPEGQPSSSYASMYMQYNTAQHRQFNRSTAGMLPTLVREPT